MEIQLIIVLVIAFIVLGPERMMDLAVKLGEAVRKVRDMWEEVRMQAYMEEINKKVLEDEKKAQELDERTEDETIDEYDEVDEPLPDVVTEDYNDDYLNEEIEVSEEEEEIEKDERREQPAPDDASHRTSKEPVIKSYPEVELITLSPTEPLFILIKISLTVGLIIASPVILFEIWRFVEPALYPQEKRLFIPLLLSSILLFVMGGVFAYAVVLPMALKFLLGLGFSQLAATPYLSVNLYVSFVLKMLIAFGIAFEMPIFLYMLQRAGVVSQQQLKRFRRYFIVVAFLVGALIAPDVATQVLMAIPLLVLYEVSILLGKTVKKKDKERSLAKVEEEEGQE